MVDIIHRIGIEAPLARVYEALTTVEGVSGWWTHETRGSAKQGGAFEVIFRSHGQERGRMSFDVVSARTDVDVRWRCTAGPEDWIGTEVTFALTKDGSHTIVMFGHRGFRDASDFTAHCSTKWATFLLSLRALVETGTGQPAPNDLKIDTWN